MGDKRKTNHFDILFPCKKKKNKRLQSYTTHVSKKEAPEHDLTSSNDCKVKWQEEVIINQDTGIKRNSLNELWHKHAFIGTFRLS